MMKEIADTLLPASLGKNSGSEGNGENKLVLVTGGSGFVGSHVIKVFLEAGYHVSYS